MRSYTPGSLQSLLAQYTAVGGNRRFFVVINSDTYRVSFQDPSTAISASVTSDWALHCLTRDGDNIALYQDDMTSVVDSDTYDQAILQTGNLIGANSANSVYNGSPSNFLSGSVSLILIYDAVHTEAQRQQVRAYAQQIYGF